MASTPNGLKNALWFSPPFNSESSKNVLKDQFSRSKVLRERFILLLEERLNGPMTIGPNQTYDPYLRAFKDGEDATLEWVINMLKDG